MDKCWSTEDVTKHGETAKAVLINHMEEKYGRGDIERDWVANLTTAKKMPQTAMDQRRRSVSKSNKATATTAG